VDLIPTTPYEMMIAREPNVSYVRVFGSRCWYDVGEAHVYKMDPRAGEAIMIWTCTLYSWVQAVGHRQGKGL